MSKRNVIADPLSWSSRRGGLERCIYELHTSSLQMAQSNVSLHACAEVIEAEMTIATQLMPQYC